MLSSFPRFLTVFACLCLPTGIIGPARADNGALGLSDAQIVRMTSEQWLAYYHHHGGSGGARGVYKALVIYTNCEEAQNKQDIKRLPAAIRQRDEQLSALLQERLKASGVMGKPGYAGASHALGARLGIADLLHQILMKQAKHDGHAAKNDADRQQQAAKIAADPSSQISDMPTARIDDKILHLVKSWPSGEKLLVLNYLKNRA